MEVMDVGKGSHLGCALKGGTWGGEKGKTGNGPQASGQGWGTGVRPRLPGIQSPLCA